MTIRIALLAFLAGTVAGYQIDIRTLPRVQRLGLTDGALCFAVDSVSGDPTAGPHWFVRADGICYLEDLPH